MSDAGIFAMAAVDAVETPKIATAKATNRYEISVRLFDCILPPIG